MDFNFIPDTDEMHNCYKIINTATGKDDKLHDIFELHYIELRKFKKTYQEIDSVLDRWSSFLTKADKLNKDNIPAELAMDKNIVKAISAVDRMFDEEERQVYETRMQTLADVESKIASAEEKGKEEAFKAIIFNMLDMGVDFNTIAGSTGLKESEIKKFIADKKS